MSTTAKTLLTEEQRGKVQKTVKEIMDSRLLDPSNPPTSKERFQSYGRGRGDILEYYKPNAFDVSRPEVVYGMVWEQYLSYLSIHGLPSNKKGTRHFDTTKKRSVTAKQLANYLERTPTAADLKAAFPTITQLDDKLCKAVNRDLENLTQ